MPKVMMQQFYALLFDMKSTRLKRLDILELLVEQLRMSLTLNCAPIEHIESILSFVGANLQ